MSRRNSEALPPTTGSPEPGSGQTVDTTQEQHGGRHPITGLLGLVLLGAVAMLLLLAPEALAASGNDVAKNLGGLLRGYAAQIYGGVLAIISLVFLINRRYVELMTFLLAAVVVGWMVFSPDAIAKAARAIGRQILG